MRIALIGMSNIRKTIWSKRLADKNGWTRVDCDEIIEQRLGSELTAQGFVGLKGMAAWMGQPYETRYAETSRKYLARERLVMLGTLDALRTAPPEEAVIIDTTGSVIYTGDDVGDALRRQVRVVCLDSSPEHAAMLFERYIAAPKPVIWGDSFNRRDEETPDEALKRCYPELLETRARRYRQLAHTVIPFEQHMKPDADLLDLISHAE